MNTKSWFSAVLATGLIGILAGLAAAPSLAADPPAKDAAGAAKTKDAPAKDAAGAAKTKDAPAAPGKDATAVPVKDLPPAADAFPGVFGMGTLPLLSGAQTRSISAENPKGEKGGGAREVPKPDSAASRMGEGWKVRPCITLNKGETTTLAEIDGPGVIQHIWITVDPRAFRTCILRMYWDGEETPSVEAPLGDFFACGHGLRTRIVSIPIAVNPAGGLNSFWPMPFQKHARITVANENTDNIGGFFYQITYALTPVPSESAYFHAQWRRSQSPREKPEHVLLDGVAGQGHYVGTYIAWAALSNGWWGEGEMKFYFDGDEEHPTICGTGTEDYFGGAWCFAEGGQRAQSYSGPFQGLPLVRNEPGEIPQYGLYRWHIADPIRFQQKLKVTIQALGWWPDGKYQPLTDDIASTSYWYQREPHGAFPALPAMEQRWPR